MVNSNKIKGLIVEHEMTQDEMSDLLGFSRRTLFDRLETGVFKSDEIETMTERFGVKEPIEFMTIFFPDVLRKMQH